jgi:hypothetical protein
VIKKQIKEILFQESVYPITDKLKRRAAKALAELKKKSLRNQKKNSSSKTNDTQEIKITGNRYF